MPDGSTRTDEARVPPKTPAGSRVTVWMDKRGGLTAEPLTDGEVRNHASLGGMLAATGAGGAVLSTVWMAAPVPGPVTDGAMERRVGTDRHPVGAEDRLA